MLARLLRNAKSLPLIGGFLFGMVGGVWSFGVDHRLEEELTQLNSARADINEQIRTLNSLASEYFIANHQGDLIFVTAHRDDARQDLASLIYKASLLDRAVPVRNMIGALAIAKVLDYRSTADAYNRLNTAAREDFSLEKFTALKNMERDLIAQGQERVPTLVQVGFAIDRAVSANKQAQKKNGLIGLLSSILGGFLLLVANLIATNSRVEPREPAVSPSPIPAPHPVIRIPAAVAARVPQGPHTE